MDSTLFDQCSNEYRDKQERMATENEAERERWLLIEGKARNSSHYKDIAVATHDAQLAYATRTSQANAFKAVDVPLDASSLTASFKSMSLNPTTDALKRKSVLPQSGKLSG